MFCDLRWRLWLSYEACSHKNIINHLQILLVRNTTNLSWMRKEAVQQNISYSKAGDFLQRVLIHSPLNWNTETCYHEIKKKSNSGWWNAWKIRYQFNAWGLRHSPIIPHPCSPFSCFPLSRIKHERKKEKEMLYIPHHANKRKQIKSIRKDETVY